MCDEQWTVVLNKLFGRCNTLQTTVLWRYYKFMYIWTIMCWTRSIFQIIKLMSSFVDLNNIIVKLVKARRPKDRERWTRRGLLQCVSPTHTFITFSQQVLAGFTFLTSRELLYVRCSNWKLCFSYKLHTFTRTKRNSRGFLDHK